MKTRIWVAALATVALAATNAFAFTVRGTVKNGTTGAMVNTEITVVNPSEGMEDVTSVQSKDGQFEIPDLGNDAPMYLVRADYAGVSYNARVPVNGQDQTVDIVVYDATKSWDGARIAVPHLAVTRDGNALHVEQLWEITNEQSPPKTIWERNGAFRMFIPADMDSLNECSVSAGDMPLRMMPTPTDKKEIFSIDYPIRPGVTRVSVAYSLPYASGSYTMKAKFPLPVPHMMVFAVDSSIAVTSSREFVSQQSVHGMSAYALHGIEANGELTLTFTGGDPNFFLHVDEHGDAHAGDAHAGGGPPQVTGAPDDSAKLAVFLMILLLFVLTGMVAVAMRDQKDPLSDPKVLRAHYNMLLSRLARLDDLNAAHTIPSDAYRASREDLMGRLGALALLLHKQGGVHEHGEHDAPEPKTKVQ